MPATNPLFQEAVLNFSILSHCPPMADVKHLLGPEVRDAYFEKENCHLSFEPLLLQLSLDIRRLKEEISFLREKLCEKS